MCNYFSILRSTSTSLRLYQVVLSGQCPFLLNAIGPLIKLDEGLSLFLLQMSAWLSFLSSVLKLAYQIAALSFLLQLCFDSSLFVLQKRFCSPCDIAVFQSFKSELTLFRFQFLVDLLTNCADR